MTDELNRYNILSLFFKDFYAIKEVLKMCMDYQVNFLSKKTCLLIQRLMNNQSLENYMMKL